jgi:hypothetical protein
LGGQINSEWKFCVSSSSIEVGKALNDVPTVVPIV